jgi:hypothetical protein
LSIALNEVRAQFVGEAIVAALVEEIEVLFGEQAAVEGHGSGWSGLRRHGRIRD